MKILLKETLFFTAVDKQDDDYLVIVRKAGENDYVFSEWLNADSAMFERVDCANDMSIDTDEKTVEQLIRTIEFVVADFARAYRIDVGRNGQDFTLMTPATPGFLGIVIVALNDDELFINTADDDVKGYVFI